MRAIRFFFSLFATTLSFTPLALAQVSPNIENGFKAYASYDSTKLDTVNLTNGDLTLHIPLPLSYPQRGGKLNDSLFLLANSKKWQVQWFFNSNGAQYYWDYGNGPYARYTVPLSPYIGSTFAISFHRTLTTEVDDSGNVSEWDSLYYLQSWDGSVHQLQDISGGNLTSFASSDISGFRLVASNPDSYGTPTTFVVTDRNGNVYQGNQFHPATLPACTKTGNGKLGSTTITTCPQFTGFSTLTDSNGNLLSTTDTLGRSFPLSSGSSSDSTGCVSSLPFAYAQIFN